ncbi:MAG TPA: hypothetical protein VF141_07930, partial [Chryseolinea sp.]
DNFTAMDDIFQAKATLQSLIDHFPLQHVKDEAKRKLNALDQLEAEKQKQTDADTLELNR